MIGIINYGLGNINAFVNIYNRLHIPIKQLYKLEDFEDVDRLILPGVGAFDHAMEAFNKSGMRKMVEKKVLVDKIPIIGICVGMQMMAEFSDEGILPGLGWISGRVRKFDKSRISYTTKLPHMGWNDVNFKSTEKIFGGFDEKSKFYFLHSFYFDNFNESDEIANSEYGYKFTCAINSNNIYGVQFHPEKSHGYGVKLLENFAKI